MIRVLVVDDSATMRGVVTATLQRDPGITVVGQAACPLEAREAIKTLDPDVITLDIEMPAMNGLDFLERIMRLRPMPVVMVSSLTTNGADATLQALELGAFDCVSKPVLRSDGSSFDKLCTIVRAAARARPRRLADRDARSASARPSTADYRSDGKVIAIGASTGGVEALLTVLERFPEHCPPTIITQHMTENFLGRFAERLDRTCKAHVSMASEGAPLIPGHIYLAPGGQTHLCVSGSGTLRCRLRAGEPVSGHRPSVDAMFKSVSEVAGANAMGVILTGMGRDGAQGLLAMRQAGARTLGQDEASCVVYGMPRVAFELSAVDEQVRLDRIADRILEVSNSSQKGQSRCQPHPL